MARGRGVIGFARAGVANAGVRRDARRDRSGATPHATSADGSWAASQVNACVP